MAWKLGKDGKIIKEVRRRARVLYTGEAYFKQAFLVTTYKTEVAWAGIVKRGGPREYIVEDIVLFPQTVYPAHWTTDQREYEEWLTSQPDEVFDNLRLHGHSHADLPTTPSGVDLEQWGAYVRALKDDMFYVFAIDNKKGELRFLIYDMMDGTAFDAGDVEFGIVGEQDLRLEADRCVKIGGNDTNEPE